MPVDTRTAASSKSTSDPTIADLAQMITKLMQERADDRARIEQLAANIATMESSMHDVQKREARTEKQTLLLGSTSQDVNHTLAVDLNPIITATTRSAFKEGEAADPESSWGHTKIDAPVFQGEDVESWIFQMERFFEVNHTPPSRQVSIAGFYLLGDALKWYQYLKCAHPVSVWSEFVEEIRCQFGPDTYWVPGVALNKLVQTGSVNDYISEFQALVTCTKGMSPENLLHRFLAGLRDDIHLELVMWKPTNLRVAMGMSRIAEQKLKGTKQSSSRSFNPKTTLQPQNTHPSYPISAYKPPNPKPMSTLPFRKLSPAEMSDRKLKGLCFNCDDKFTPGHRCKPKFQCLILEDDLF